MEVKYLVDTNIFLEILLNQEKKEKCKNFLNKHIGGIYLSDFSLHSIGVILIKYKKVELLAKFFNDTSPKIILIDLPKENYLNLLDISKKYNLDFDDAYQSAVANFYELEIVTMDSDFKKISEKISVKFIN